MLVGLVVVLAASVFLLAGKGAPKRMPTVSGTKDYVEPKNFESRKSVAADDGLFIKTPPKTIVIKHSSKVNGDIRESVLKLESELSPTELQIYYTDMLLKDWMIPRDDLTKGIGWSGVFEQIEPKERSMGIFAVVKSIGPISGPENPTIISIIRTEEL